MKHLERIIEEYVQNGLVGNMAVRVGVGGEVLYETFRAHGTGVSRFLCQHSKSHSALFEFVQLPYRSHLTKLQIVRLILVLNAVDKYFDKLRIRSC